MTVTKINHLKQYAHDVLRQPKKWTKSIKYTVIYKDNKPMYWNRKTREYELVSSRQTYK